MTQTSSPPHGRFHPTGAPFRFAVLLFVSLLTFGSYFAYDSVGAIAPTLIEALGLGRESIGQMYTLYSVAAILSVSSAAFSSTGSAPGRRASCSPRW